MSEMFDTLSPLGLIIMFAEVFESCDMNQDGQIDQRELRVVLERHWQGVTVTEERILRMIDAVDDDKDGRINFGEFIKMMKARTVVKDLQEKMTEMFRTFDVDNDGVITCEELRRVLEGVGDTITQEQTQLIIQRYDDNNDGVVSLQEFLATVDEIRRK